MQPEQYRTMIRVQDRLWWYGGMEQIARALLDRRYQRKGRLRVLDAGCGTGAALRYLADYGDVTALDLVPYALQLMCRCQHQYTCGSVMALPFADESFDLVAALDLLPMMGIDDRGALAEVRRVLAPGGRVLVRCGAYEGMGGEHDRIWGAVHRYTARELREKLAGAGLIVEQVSYANMWLFPPIAAKRVLDRFLPPQHDSDFAFDAGPLNRLLALVLSSEAPLVARVGLPFGLSVVAVARRS
jgi:SAM-dependent methyltransferase